MLHVRPPSPGQASGRDDRGEGGEATEQRHAAGDEEEEEDARVRKKEEINKSLEVEKYKNKSDRE